MYFHSINFRQFVLQCFVVAALFVVSFQDVDAATFSVSPSTANIDVGETITLTVSVSSTSQAMNAFSGRIYYPTNLLGEPTINTSGTIVNFWTIQPSSEAGAVRFEGLVLNPGFTGTGGKLFTVTWKAEGTGIATFELSQASVLANDGLGTNILSGTLPKSIVTIGQSGGLITTPSTSGTNSPLPPLVTSPTHLDSNDWYAVSEPQFEWQVPVDVTSISFALDKNATTTPTQDKGLTSSYASTEIQNGTWYFHLRLKNSYGWGGTTHFKINVDRTKPTEFTITKVEIQPEDGSAHFLLNAADETSGIENFEISIDASSPVIWKKTTEDSLYSTGVLSLGQHQLVIRAVDYAGNNIVNVAYFTYEGISAPIILGYTQELDGGTVFRANGTAIANSSVVFEFKKENETWIGKIFGKNRISEENIVKVNQNGTFDFTMKTSWKVGEYHFVAKARLDNGAESTLTESYSVSVLPGVFGKFMNMALRIILPIIPILIAVLLLFVIGILILRGWRKYKKMLHIQVGQAKEVTAQSMKIIDQEVVDEIEILKKVRAGEPLSIHEQEFLAKLRNDLLIAGSIIEKEIDDVDKKIR